MAMGPRSSVARGRSVQLDCKYFLSRIGAQRQGSSAELLSEVQQNAVRPLEVSAPVIIRDCRSGNPELSATAASLHIE